MFIVGICIVNLFPPHYHFAALLLWSTFSLFTYTWRGRPSRHVRPPRLSEQESEEEKVYKKNSNQIYVLNDYNFKLCWEIGRTLQLRIASTATHYLYRICVASAIITGKNSKTTDTRLIRW